jgi:hypothetical protein
LSSRSITDADRDGGPQIGAAATWLLVDAMVEIEAIAVLDG